MGTVWYQTGLACSTRLSQHVVLGWVSTWYWTGSVRGTRTDQCVIPGQRMVPDRVNVWYRVGVRYQAVPPAHVPGMGSWATCGHELASVAALPCSTGLPALLRHPAAPFRMGKG